MVEVDGEFDGKVILAGIILKNWYFFQLVQFVQKLGHENIFDIDPTSAFGIQEQEEDTNRAYQVLLFVILAHALQMMKGGDELGYVFLKVGLS